MDQAQSETTRETAPSETTRETAPSEPDPRRLRSNVRRSGLGCAVEVVQTLVLTLVIFLVIQNLVAQPFQVEQFSMQHTFEPGDYVLVDKLTPRWDAYERGDVVVFNSPDGSTTEREPFIKRVIGVPGDTIEVRDDGLVYVNGVALDEGYLYKNHAGVQEPTNAQQARWVVPDGEVFVMGDHRQQSVDSRAFGPIPTSSVLGRAVVRYWPLAAFGIIETPSYPGVPGP